MTVIRADVLCTFAKQLLESYGVSRKDARIVAASIIETNLAGHDSHGILLLPTYLDRIRNGRIKLRAPISIKKDLPGITLLDGGWNFGQLIAKKAMELAIKKALTEGIALIATINTNHVGRLGQYTSMAAEQGLIAIMMVNSGPAVAPWPGLGKKLGTNPISVAVPRKNGGPILLDMATSVVAGGKVLLNSIAGNSIPEGWIIDKNGRPSTNPTDFDYGALLSLGTYKGYGLAFMIDVLCGAFTGAGTADKIKGTNGVFILVLKGDSFVTNDELRSSIEDLAQYVIDTPVREGFSKIMLPGDPEYAACKERLRDGISVEDNLLEDLRKIAKEQGVSFSF